VTKRKPLPLPREDPRWVPVIELHARLAKQLGSVVEADQYLTVEFRKEPSEGIRTMRAPPKRPGGRALPEEDLSLIEWLDRDAERDLPEAGCVATWVVPRLGSPKLYRCCVRISSPPAT
jgi:hypothetical protein